eukprot:CAMPEP_0119555610 /NCGR_PEP_ID=MMETSP1352-20130426/7771_1 /TAXON_ID=265584 /ORGANISM="Stauroneis constricta, Strain CCMP1120" /LENGTH=39 /DNA_ID= /DNA_START= /DNA_END= /DNA_ORIENTATION=
MALAVPPMTVRMTMIVDGKNSEPPQPSLGNTQTSAPLHP